MEEKMTRDSARRPHSGGCCQVRMSRPSTGSLHTSCFGVNPAPAASGGNRADLFQHSELQDMDSERVAILVLAPLSPVLYCFLLLYSNPITIVHTVLFSTCGLVYFSDPDMHVSISPKGSRRCRWFGFSLAATSEEMETSKKLQPSPSTRSPMSPSYTAPSGCAQNSGAGTQGLRYR